MPTGRKGHPSGKRTSSMSIVQHACVPAEYCTSPPQTKQMPHLFLLQVMSQTQMKYDLLSTSVGSQILLANNQVEKLKGEKGSSHLSDHPSNQLGRNNHGPFTRQRRLDTKNHTDCWWRSEALQKSAHETDRAVFMQAIICSLKKHNCTRMHGHQSIRVLNESFLRSYFTTSTFSSESQF